MLVRHMLLVGAVACATASPQPEPAGPEPAAAPPTDEPAFPPLEEKETVSVDTPVEGIAIRAVPLGAAGWKVQVENQTSGMVTVLWDESTFVSKRGESLGRLIRGETRRIDVANAQPPTPIAASARVTQGVLVEQLLGQEEMEETALKLRRPSQELVDMLAKARAVRADAIVDGRLHITLQLASEKKTWVGRVSGGE